jgi:hypothetical protein
MIAIIKSAYRVLIALPSKALFLFDRLLALCLLCILKFNQSWLPQNSLTQKTVQKIILCGFAHRRHNDHESVEATTMFATFAHSRYHSNAQTFFYDEHRFVSMRFIFSLCNHNPTHVVLSSYNPLSHRCPSRTALKFANDIGINLIFFWWDTCSKNFYYENRDLINMAWRNIVIDNPQKQFFPRTTNWEKFKFLHTPVKVSLNTESIQDRKNFLFFTGSNTSYRSNRNRYIEELKKIKSLDLAQISTNKNLTYDQYRGAMSSSMICVSFPESVECDQLKARVLEAMGSGALLLDRENLQTSSLYEPNLDYIPFKDATDLRAIIEEIIKNPQNYSMIARRGYVKTKALCDPNYFWGKIFALTESE